MGYVFDGVVIGVDGMLWVNVLLSCEFVVFDVSDFVSLLIVMYCVLMIGEEFLLVLFFLGKWLFNDSFDF